MISASLFSTKSASKASALAIRQRARHKWPVILENSGIDPSYLQNKHGPCPACGGVDRFRFDDRTDNGDYYCNQCGAGDGISLLMKTHAWTAQQALQAVARWLDMAEYGTAVPPPRSPAVAAVTAPSPATIARAQRRIQRLWTEAIPLDDPKAEVAFAYFAYRGLTHLSPLPCDVRLHPSLPYWWQDPDSNVIEIGQWPALLAVVRNLDGKARGLHRTYLAPDGQGKAQVLSPTGEPLPIKKLMALSPGATRGCAVRLYPVTDGKLAVAEGIETALAIIRANPGWPCWAAMFAGNLAHVEIPADVEIVAICMDNDSNNVGQTAGKALARRLLRLSRPPVVKLLTPPEPDTDFLDLWVGRRHG